MRANIKITELNRCDSILSLCSHGYDHAITLQFNVMLNFKSKVRQDIDTFHDQWYQEALDTAQKAGVEESMPRLAGRQTRRDNPESRDPKDYYKKTALIQFLDYVLSEMDKR